MAKIPERYERQLLLPQIGPEGQQKLAKARVAVLGAGGLGAPVLQYLAVAGVGALTIIDGDVVSPSNLNRQVLYTAADIGRPKALLSAAAVRRLNPDVAVTPLAQMLTAANAQSLLQGHDAAMFCLDNAAARLLATRAAVALGLPCVEGAVEAFHGRLMMIVPGQGPCYECLHGQVAPRTGPAAVIGAMPGMVGSMMALLALQHLLGLPTPVGRLLLIDGRRFEIEHLAVKRNPACPACGGARG
ncbi:MAG: HesA/MoeB/ThiF family protein [Ruminococcaceae bacterium]|nr:HesA/MoeB/ThiF family protein [Oscillospiraceae bacterium]